MIDFKLRNKYYQTDAYSEERSDQAQRFIDGIQEKVKPYTDKSGIYKYELGCKLIDFYITGAYASRARDKELVRYYGSFDSRNGHSKVFFAVCELYFDLDKGTVSRLMNVVDEFGDKQKRSKGFAPEYKDYKWSVLAEMLSMSEEERKLVTPDMTVKRVRELKKQLVATSQQNKKDESDALMKPGNSDKFKNYTRRDLLIYINELELFVGRARGLVSVSDKAELPEWRDVFEERILAEEKQDG